MNKETANTEEKKFVRQETKGQKIKFVPADKRCKKCFYWRYLGGVRDEVTYCCHYALVRGKLRKRISETECGSFEEKKGNRKRGIRFEPVPMSQWGCSGLGTIRKGER